MLDVGVAREVDDHVLIVTFLVDGREGVALQRFQPLVSILLADARRRKLDVAVAHREQQRQDATGVCDGWLHPSDLFR